jgi:hypothetical protein
MGEQQLTYKVPYAVIYISMRVPEVVDSGVAHGQEDGIEGQAEDLSLRLVQGQRFR